MAALLREGGVVFAMRHALAPGTFDPPGFRLDACATQRNLSEQGREQARRLGRWFQRHELSPSRVRSSPWCRCMDTARLAFGQTEVWPALGSPRGGDERQRQAHLRQLREALAQHPPAAGRFEVWVTHMFVLSDLVGGSADSGEGLVLRWREERPQVLARLPA